MPAVHDLKGRWWYVHRGLVWHIAHSTDDKPYTPSRLALCGTRAEWTGYSQGARPVGKLCRKCRAAISALVTQ